jgi:hypothetical protein
MSQGTVGAVKSVTAFRDKKINICHTYLIFDKKKQILFQPLASHNQAACFSIKHD